MIALGRKAPAFALPDQSGVTTSLRDLAGRWVVLYFYPRDDTPGCTIEACEFAALVPAFQGLDAEVLGCSADPAPTHRQFIAKYDLAIRLLTDADRKVMRAYGAWGEKVMYGKKVQGVIRSTVLIAPDGTVAHHWPKVRAEGHAADVRERLRDLQGAAAAPSRVRRATAAAKPTAARASSRGRASTASAVEPARPGAATRKSAARRPAAAKRATANAGSGPARGGAAGRRKGSGRKAR